MADWLRVKIAWSISGVVFGISVFIVFLEVYSNYHTAIWGLASGAAAASVAWLHMMQHSRKLKMHCSCIAHMRIAGITMQCLSAAACVTYVVLAAVDGQDLSPYGSNYYMAAIWCFMTWKWSFQLYLFSRRYLREIRENFLPLDNLAVGGN